MTTSPRTYRPTVNDGGGLGPCRPGTGDRLTLDARQLATMLLPELLRGLPRPARVSLLVLLCLAIAVALVPEIPRAPFVPTAAPPAHERPVDLPAITPPTGQFHRHNDPSS